MIGLNISKEKIKTVLKVKKQKIEVIADYMLMDKLRSIFVYTSSNASVIKEKGLKKLKKDLYFTHEERERRNLELRIDILQKWDGTTKLFFKNFIGTGHLETLKMILRDLNEEFEIQDNRKKSSNVELYYKKNIVLRPEQEIAMSSTRKADYQGLLCLGTGFGKTIMGNYIMQELQTRTIIFANTQLITKQWTDTILKHFDLTPLYFKSSSSVMFKNKENESVILICSSILIINVFKNKQSLKERNDKIRKFIKQTDLILFDEVQDAGTRKIYSMLNKIPAFYKLGLSATIHSRTDNKDFLYLSYFGEILYEYNNTDMIEDKLRRKIDVHYMICRAYPASRFVDNGSYSDLYLKKIVRNFTRNEMIIYKVNELLEEEGRQILVFVKYTEQGEHFETYMDGAIYMRGSTSSKDREIIKQNFLDGKQRVLIATNTLANKGFSLKNLNTIFLMDDSTLNGTTQSLGRLFHSDAEKLELYDVYDTIPPFVEHSKSRFKIYSKNHNIINLKNLRKQITNFGL